MSWALSPETRILRLAEPLALERGGSLAEVQVAYRTWGDLAPAGDNAVLICHALTGSADADDWWGGLLGPDRALDPRRDFVVSSNVLGSCYGTTGPASPLPDGSGVYGPDFSAITVRDMVHLQARLLDELGVRRLKLVVGGSLGGMQVLEWALLYPERVEAIAPFAVSARHSAWCIALSEAQRQAIEADPSWQGGRYDPAAPPAAGLAAARAMAMCTYRSRASFEARFGRRQAEEGAGFEVESYLRYQGRKLVERFDANSYVVLTRAMDSHDLGRGRGPIDQVLAGISQPALVVSIDSDVLYLPEEQRELVQHLPHGRLETISSPHGHDAFLIETEALGRSLSEFRRRLEGRRPLRRIGRGQGWGTRSGGALASPRPPAARRVDVVLVGATGRVGSALAAQLEAVRAPLAQAPQVGVDLRIVGALNRRRMAWVPQGIAPRALAAALEAGEPTDWPSLLERLYEAEDDPLVFIDCTASPEVAALYVRLLERGIAVVTPNKRANAGPLAAYERLRRLGANVPFRYETNVGAALPILGTLADLKRAGDRLRSVTAVLSGTLAFVLHRVEQGALFSAAVREAHALAYTEPHPREDLSGEDVARKLLILLREAGFPCEREDLKVEPMVPEDLAAEEDPERFMDSLVALDTFWAERTAAARARGQRLFYLASFYGTEPRVGVAALPADHAVGRGAPGENIVVYSTDRYPKLPLTISGPGAGPEVTATGVLNDLIGAARQLAWRAPAAPRLAQKAEPVSAPRYATAHRPVLFVV
jgi:homoserine O-acetyltransferase